MDEKFIDTETAEDLQGNIPETAAEDADPVIITIDDDDPGVDAEDLQNEVFSEISARESHIGEYVPPKLGPLKWIENFIYRNKTLIFIFIGAVLLIGYLVFTSLPGKHDLRLPLYVSYSDFTSSVQPYLENELVNYCEDWDGDENISVLTRKFDISVNAGFAGAAYYQIFQDHLNGEPEAMLWVVDEGLYEMIVEGYGEDFFQSYKGAPKWIEITWNEKVNDCVNTNQSPRFGFCLLPLTDEFAKDEELCASYETATKFLDKLFEARPEILEAQ